MTGLHLPSSTSHNDQSPRPTPQSATDDNFDNLWYFLAFGLLYLMLQHYVCVLFSRICKYPFLAIMLSGLTISEMTLASGFTLHVDNLPEWYRFASPLRWVFSLLLPRLHTPEALLKSKNCKSKQILRDDIIVQGNCETPNGDLAMRELSILKMDDGSIYMTWLFIAAGVLMSTVFLAYLIIRYTKTKRSLKSVPNKP